MLDSHLRNEVNQMGIAEHKWIKHQRTIVGG